MTKRKPSALIACVLTVLLDSSAHSAQLNCTAVEYLQLLTTVVMHKVLSLQCNSTKLQITAKNRAHSAMHLKAQSRQCMLQGSNETNGAQNVQQLLRNRPDAVNPIIGYNILPAAYNVADMTAGKSLDTTDTAKSGTSVQGAPETLKVNVTSNSGSTAQVCCMLLW